MPPAEQLLPSSIPPPKHLWWPLATKTTQSTPKKFFFLHFFWFQNLSERKRVVRERGVMGERKVAVRERATVERDGLVREGAAVRERERELLWVTGEKTGVLWGNERDGAAAEGEREAREGEREWCERKREYFGAREALEEEADCCVWKRGPREREGECWERERKPWSAVSGRRRELRVWE